MKRDSQVIVRWQCIYTLKSKAIVNDVVLLAQVKLLGKGGAADLAEVELQLKHEIVRIRS